MYIFVTPTKHPIPATFRVNNALIISNQIAEFQINLPKQIIVTGTFVGHPKTLQFQVFLCLT